MSARVRWLAPAAVAVLLVGVLADLTEDVVHGGGPASLDPSRLAFVADHRSALVVDASRWLAWIGRFPVLVVLALAAGALLWRSGQRLIVAAAPTIALLLTGLVTGIAKSVIDRPRPGAALQLATETNGSFPSGHTSNTTALLVSLAVVVAVAYVSSTRRRIAVVAVAGIGGALMGGSRLVLGVHWPTDVVAGWILGTLIATAVALTLTAPTTTPNSRE